MSLTTTLYCISEGMEGILPINDMSTTQYIVDDMLV